MKRFELLTSEMINLWNEVFQTNIQKDHSTRFSNENDRESRKGFVPEMTKVFKPEWICAHRLSSENKVFGPPSS